jgi:ubiquinone/menaquinone biosynthesis C-methylase UbiE
MKLEKLIELYKKTYNLPVLIYKKKISAKLASLYKKKHFFVVICIYNKKNQIFLIRDFNKNIGWELPGGYVEDYQDIISSLHDITLRETGLEINEIEPIAIVKNNFAYKNKIIENIGIAFRSNVKGIIKDYPENIKGCFVSDFPHQLAYQNNRIIKLAQKNIKLKKHAIPQREIDCIKNKNFALFHILHSLFIKPLGIFSSKKIENKLISLISGKPKSILDVSCGDNNLINKLYQKYSPELCIGNDISWKTISLLKNKDNNVIFTNHNLLDIPFKRKFDLVIFKNTLHHIARKEQIEVLVELKKIAKQLIIIDVDDPNYSDLISRVWNNYYRYILQDQGNYFLTFNKFKKILSDNFSNKKIITGKINTIKGVYYFGSIY